MAHEDRGLARFVELIREAEGVSERLGPQDLPKAVGALERLKTVLWSRLNATAVGGRTDAACRLEVADIVRAFRSEIQASEPPKARTRTDGLLTVPQTAQLLALRESTIRSWLLHRRLPVVKLGRAVRIRENDVRRLIEDGYVPARPDR